MPGAHVLTCTSRGLCKPDKCSSALRKVQTPYLCESASDLLSYYESLPLERRQGVLPLLQLVDMLTSRLDGLFGVLLTLELLSSANVLRRDENSMRSMLFTWHILSGESGRKPSPARAAAWTCTVWHEAEVLLQ